MYTPAHFALTDPEALHRILRMHPLGTLVRGGPAGLEADHLPFEFDPHAGSQGVLVAHVARANPLWQTCSNGTPVMVIFRGEQGYISPNGYPSKAETHRQVPTWNYEAVHVHGTLNVRDDVRFVRGVVGRLTRRHEASEPHPWKMSDGPADYIEDLLSRVVGLEITITSMQGKSKLSQNKDDRDRQGVIDALTERGQHPLAHRMREI